MSKDLVASIMCSNKTLQLEANGGTVVSNLETALGKEDALFNDAAIASVLSHSLLAYHCRVVSDSHHSSCFFVCMGTKS